MVVIKGVRRTGKSSLLRVGLAECGLPHLLLDVREFVAMSPERAQSLLVDSLRRMSHKFPTLKNVLKEVPGALLRQAGLVPEFKSTLTGTLEKLNEWAEVRRKPLVLAVDEAQRLRHIRGFEEFLGYCFEHLKGIKLILTGSEVGLLDRLLGEEETDAPLFGHPYYEIVLKRLDSENSKEFLRVGLEQLGVRVPESEISEAVGSFDGVIGWLVAYGYYRAKFDHRRAVGRTVRYGSRLVKGEVDSFLRQREQARTRYLLIMRMLAAPLRWSDVKRGLAAKMGRTLSNKQLSHYLAELVDYGFVVKDEENRYVLADPLVVKAVTGMS